VVLCARFIGKIELAPREIGYYETETSLVHVLLAVSPEIKKLLIRSC